MLGADKSDSMQIWRDFGYNIVGDISWDILDCEIPSCDIIVTNIPFETGIKKKVPSWKGRGEVQFPVEFREAKPSRLNQGGRTPFQNDNYINRDIVAVSMHPVPVLAEDSDASPASGQQAMMLMAITPIVAPVNCGNRIPSHIQLVFYWNSRCKR